MLHDGAAYFQNTAHFDRDYFITNFCEGARKFQLFIINCEFITIDLAGSTGAVTDQRYKS